MPSIIAAMRRFFARRWRESRAGAFRFAAVTQLEGNCGLRRLREVREGEGRRGVVVVLRDPGRRWWAGVVEAVARCRPTG